MSEGVYRITEEFEQVLADYTGAPYAVAVNSCTMGLFLSLMYQRRLGAKALNVHIPSHTYMSVPCYIIHAGYQVCFEPSPEILAGAYQLKPLPVWDSALRFTSRMYLPGQFMCLSFTGPRKILKLGKGGAILTDDRHAADWFKQARYSGRHEVPYHVDCFDMIGWDCYLSPEAAARGLLLMSAFPTHNADLALPYPDLSQFPVYTHPELSR
jgi:dTDP-4-amino-4,6-dideoxygalactose transaminase